MAEEPIAEEPVPPFPDGGEKASGSTVNPESAHEPKGRGGRPSSTQPTNQGPNKVRKDSQGNPNTNSKSKSKNKSKNKRKSKSKPRPRH